MFYTGSGAPSPPTKRSTTEHLRKVAVLSQDEVLGGGASSIKRSSKEPLCDFDPEHGFSINESQTRMHRWYDQEK